MFLITLTWVAYLQHVLLLIMLSHSRIRFCLTLTGISSYQAAHNTKPCFCCVACKLIHKHTCFLNWRRTRLITVWSKQTVSRNSDSRAVWWFVNTNEILKKPLEAYSITSVIFLKTNKGCSLSGEKEVWALMVSYSVSYWSRKIDQFPGWSCAWQL